jgi:hypothetical protein
MRSSLQGLAIDGGVRCLSREIIDIGVILGRYRRLALPIIIAFVPGVYEALVESFGDEGECYIIQEEDAPLD